MRKNLIFLFLLLCIATTSGCVLDMAAIIGAGTSEAIMYKIEKHEAEEGRTLGGYLDKIRQRKIQKEKEEARKTLMKKFQEIQKEKEKEQKEKQLTEKEKMAELKKIQEKAKQNPQQCDVAF